MCLDLNGSKRSRLEDCRWNQVPDSVGLITADCMPSDFSDELSAVSHYWMSVNKRDGSCRGDEQRQGGNESSK